MPPPPRAIHYTVVVVDVEGFGDGARTTPDQLKVRKGLYRALRRAFGWAGLPWARCRREDRGDGVLVLAPAWIPKALFVDSLPGALAAAVREHNRDHRAGERVRLRMALHAGEVAHDDHGVTGDAVNLTFRLVNSDPVRAALTGSSGVLAVIASDWFHDNVIRHTDDVDAAAYQPVPVVAKKTETVGWVCLPDDGHPPGTVYLPPRHATRHAVLPGVLFAVLALVTAGLPSSGPLPENTSAALPAVGDPRTADPCALIEPAVPALRRFGTASIERHYGNFDRCDLRVQPPEAGELLVTATLVNPGPMPDASTGRARKLGAVTVVFETAPDRSCDHLMALPDRNRVVVGARATRRSDTGQPDLCGVADVAAEQAAGALNRGALRNRRALPEHTLVNVDACRLLGTADFAGLDGIDARHREAGFGNWDCEWDATNSDTWVRLRFDQNPPLDPTEHRPQRVGRHTVFVTPEEEGEVICLARVAYRTFEDNGGPKAEMLHLEVGGPLPVDQLCTHATTLAAAAADKLPPVD
ncbi:hypothetical protein ABZ816_18850 [Actinosynnema sp. NPDC047251]|uniref:Guanylate cyclase domain-containing protein n=1 Tax=Saccharothrix espanaensis (strain ATCC 51144 / DSM 44229 / JCM 9112 / NBRC 15066 / NRRL 15764) TaxID=1179773 RepID=K0K4R0_SACES|nr:hypothetical protein [Saccharothrix espanaensis]CCH33281.1 hypothetical protein BN6_60250 [Saccharothrix espanaensis DSM 44229]